MIETGLRGKVVVVTGGAAGIGLATAKRFAEEGCRVSVWDVNASGADSVRVDVTNSESVAGAVDSVLKIGVLNVGTGGQATFKNLPAIKFLADGTVDETSPQTVALQDVDGFSRMLVLGKLRTGYEVTDTSGK